MLSVLLAVLIFISCSSLSGAQMDAASTIDPSNSTSPSPSLKRASAGTAANLAATSSVACNRTPWQTVGPERAGGKVTTVWKEPGHLPFFFSAKMAIDADGSPHAYNPSNTGLDDNRNAKNGSRWVGVAIKNDGTPFIQGPQDPAPGCYVSTTTLQDTTKRKEDPHRYTDSETIPFIALPPKVLHAFGHCAQDAQACLGDVAFVVNSANGKTAFAIVADVGPRKRIGEGSIALANALGIPPSPRHGGAGSGVYYLVFPGSGNEKPKSLDEINAIGADLLAGWGGKEKLTTCLSGTR
jgi:hypothetical protein